MSQWLQSAKATVSAGAAVISFTDNKDFSSVRAGDVLMVNGQIWQCASGTRPDSTGKSTVTLAAPWPYTGASNVNAFVFRTTHDLLQLTSDARKLTNITKALLAAQEDILKGTTPTINVPIGLDPATGNEEVIQVTPWQYVINVVNASLGNISAIGAMSQAQFEAIRSQNNETFDASGFVHKGKQYTAAVDNNAVNQGLWTVETSSNVFNIGGDTGLTLTGTSKTTEAILNIAGIIFNLLSINSPTSQRVYNRIKFPQAPDGKTTYNKSTGVITTHATVTAAFNAQAAAPTNVEVVTDRVDMWGFEAWLEEVNTSNPYIYPNGLIQSKATTMEGIATSASARPVTYYAVFDGDTDSKGRGLNFFALTDAQKKKVLANPKNNLYYLDDGRLVQWRLRQRTVAGAGNGDWVSVSTVTDSFSVRFSANNDVIPQGILNTTSGRQATQYFYASKNPPSSVADSRFIGDAGVYQIRPSSAELCGINGQCYFLVCGTVNRLNQGAYHPSFNPSGTASWRSAQQPYWPCSWDNRESRTKLSGEPTNKASCFTATLGTSNGGYGNIGTAPWDGYNRPDKRFYDAIYADGQGGVCRDMRYSAYGVDSVDFAEADQRVKNGTYRGFEKILTSNNATFTEAIFSGGATIITNAQRAGHHVLADNAGLIIHNGFVYQVARHVANDFWVRINRFINGVATVGNYFSDIDFSKPFIFIPSVGNSVDKVLKAPPLSGIKTVSVGGSFLQIDVIGNPNNILATPALANGWQGSWIPVIPDGTIKDFEFSRKNTGTGEIPRIITTNNGSSWQSSPLASSFRSLSKNAVEAWGAASGVVALFPYSAVAKQTEDAVNGVVYGGSAGVGEVFATSDYILGENRGVLLRESLINGVKGVLSYTNGPMQVLKLSQATLNSDMLISGRAAYNPTHAAIIIDGNVSINAVKALNYNVNLNQQAFIQYAYTELKHNGTNWGDDGKVTIVDNQSTKTDLNGNTVLVGTAKLKEPIGWIKNKV